MHIGDLGHRVGRVTDRGADLVTQVPRGPPRVGTWAMVSVNEDRVQ